ncbi:MAG: iron chelate uptake ABC transporter family permease subunit [Candidatus Moduliflexus flocculans]|nr:iron chelate uptake ABC transporter family permease subunit [Candidatus Moduliflexus flocculans]
MLPLVLLVLALNVGAYRIPPKAVFPTDRRGRLSGRAAAGPSPYADILFRIRLPRLLLALFAGAALAVSGASLQALFQQSPGLRIQPGHLVRGGLRRRAVARLPGPHGPAPGRRFRLRPGRRPPGRRSIAGRSASQVVTVLLSGVIVSALFQALLSMVEVFANPYALQSLVFWLMGSLGQATWGDLAVTLPVIGAGVAVLVLMRWRLNVLSLGEDEARSLGVDTRPGQGPGHRPGRAGHRGRHGRHRGRQLDRAHRAPSRPHGRRAPTTAGSCPSRRASGLRSCSWPIRCARSAAPSRSPSAS